MLKSNLTIGDGKFLIRLARDSIKNFLNKNERLMPPPETPEKFMEKSGVFVTLNKKDNSKELRGCIGYPYPTDPLVIALLNSAIEAATGDPRFPPITIDELNKIIVEVSVLTKPDLIKVDEPLELPKKIKVGEDGLIIEKGHIKGLLLPQVPIEWNWDNEEYLANLCAKAGLPFDCWIMEETKVYKFQAMVFEEEEPNGKIHLRNLR